jgi:hypothetical protein
MRRRLWIAPVAGLLALIAAHFGYWWYLQTKLRDGLEAWLAERRAAGWTVAAGAETRGGWPLTASLRVASPSIAGGDPDIPGGIAWGAEALELRLDLLAPGVLHLAADGHQRLRVARLPEIAFSAADAGATMPLAPTPGTARISFVSHDVQSALASAPGAGTVTLGLVQIDVETQPGASKDASAVTFRVAAEAIGLPDGRAWALGSRISSASIEGAVSGPVPGGHGVLARVANWRDGGGILAIRDMALGWGPLGLSGSGVLGLDSRLQPEGEGRVRMIGYATALDTLASARAIAPGAATAAKAVLSLLATVPSDGGPPIVEVPLLLQDRVLSMRQLPLLRVPELIWPVPDGHGLGTGY